MDNAAFHRIFVSRWCLECDGDLSLLQSPAWFTLPEYTSWFVQLELGFFQIRSSFSSHQQSSADVSWPTRIGVGGAV